MGRIHELPKSSARLLTSSQIITSVFCVVKELIENALDGAAKNVEVKLEDYGLEKIEVKDNGCGIDKNDIPFVARSHFTSKISSYSDLEKVSTYGFRGEALGAICAVADLTITTKTSEENIGFTVSYDHTGEVLSTKPCPCPQGSTVSVLNLFKNIPVRRQYYRSDKNKKDDLRKVEELLIAYGCIAHDVRFALYHNKNLIWQKPALSCTKNALIQVLGNSVVDHMKYSEYVDEQNLRKFEVYLPVPEAPMTCGLNSTSRCVTAINKRPVRIKELDKLIKEYYNKAIQNTGKARYPICFIAFTMPLTEVDVNIEPNKTNVMLHHSDEIINQFSEMLKKFYNISMTENNLTALPTAEAEVNLKPKQNTSDFLDSLKNISDDKFHQTKILYLAESPVTGKKNILDDDVSVVYNSSQKRENPVVKKDLTKEPCKKKLKTSFHASKNDVQDHLTSLKQYFSQDKLNDNSMPFSTVPTVTVERINNVPKSSSSDTILLDSNTDSNQATSFAVSSNICTDNYPLVINGITTNRKRHFSDSSVSNLKLPADSVKRPVIDNGEAWSRGIHSAGGLFEPVKVLQPKSTTVPESSSKTSSIVVTESTKDISEQKSLSFERKLTAFDIFCRNNRLEVAAQNPEFNNQQIAQILSEKWNQLSPEEKAVYKNMLDKNYKQSIKKKETLSKIVSQSLSQSQNKPLEQNKIQQKMKPKLKDKVVSFQTEDVTEYFKNKNREMLLNDELNIINYLAPGIFICSKERKLHLLNTFRLHETVIYHRLLETFRFEPNHLEKPLNITTNDIGNEGMEVLMKLSELATSNTVNIDDQRLTSNGFNVKVSKDIQNDLSVELIGITTNIAFYGIPDLKELLLLIKSKGYSTNLSQCRPGKIMLYLQSEANRMSRQSPPFQRIQDVEDLLNQNNYLNKYKECMHHKPFFSELWSLE